MGLLSEGVDIEGMGSLSNPSLTGEKSDRPIYLTHMPI